MNEEEKQHFFHLTMSQAYQAGYEQGLAQAETMATRDPSPPAPPRKGFTHEAWNALDDDKKIEVLLHRLDDLGTKANLLREVAHRLLGESRRHFFESIDSIFCTGCGDIQRIDERGDLDCCQCSERW